VSTLLAATLWPRPFDHHADWGSAGPGPRCSSDRTGGAAAPEGQNWPHTTSCRVMVRSLRATAQSVGRKGPAEAMPSRRDTASQQAQDEVEEPWTLLTASQGSSWASTDLSLHLVAAEGSGSSFRGSWGRRWLVISKSTPARTPFSP